MLKILALLLSTASAQTPPDPVVLQRAVNVLQQQRNIAMDQAAQAEIRAVTQAEEIKKLQEELAKLQGKSGGEGNSAK